MDKKICIAIDAMGGENAPYKNIEGISLFCKKYKKKDDYFFNIFGDENKINVELKKYNIPDKYFRIFHTKSTVNVVEDKKTGEYRISHHIDLKTGLYNGKKILDI